MCGRFVAAQHPNKVADFFGATFDGPAPTPNFNVAPTHDVLAVVADADGQRMIESFRWGLVPSWAKDLKIGSSMINARAETLASKPAFKGLFAKHRVIIPMDGFYEWRAPGPDAALDAKGKPMKTPMYIHRTDGQMLAVAGLWAAWRDRAGGPDTPWLHSCTVITTTANATMAPVHDRMPVILPADHWDRWLDPTNRDVTSLADLLVPAGDDVLTMHAVATAVNNVRNNTPDLVDPTPQPRL